MIAHFNYQLYSIKSGFGRLFLSFCTFLTVFSGCVHIKNALFSRKEHINGNGDGKRVAGEVLSNIRNYFFRGYASRTSVRPRM